MADQNEMIKVDDVADIAPFDPTKKKKKKKLVAPPQQDSVNTLIEKIDNVVMVIETEESDGDYKYEELLGRVLNTLRESNPELSGDRPGKVTMPTPQVLREGTKKTVLVNFTDLCKSMHRQLEHVMAFLLAEMGTSGSLDGQQRLVVKGRFAPKNFEAILRCYHNEYVTCNGCKGPDTILSKENRLLFLTCEKCRSGRSVAPIKAGFVARVGSRRART